MSAKRKPSVPKFVVVIMGINKGKRGKVLARKAKLDGFKIVKLEHNGENIEVHRTLLRESEN